MLVHSHEPTGYSCPFCRIQRGEFDEWNQPSDVVAVTDLAYARIAPKWWPGNAGAVLVIPRTHFENIYGLPIETGHAMWDLMQRVAEAIKTAYECDGTSIRQHNEPAGDQDLWHLHVHVFPRYDDDRLYERHREARWVSVDERNRYAQVLRQELGEETSFVV